MAKKKTFEEIREFYKEEFNKLEQDIRRDEFKQIIADPSTRVFGKTVDEIKHALYVSESGDTAEAYKRGFKDALNTIKEVAEIQIKRV